MVQERMRAWWENWVLIPIQPPDTFSPGFTIDPFQNIYIYIYTPKVVLIKIRSHVSMTLSAEKCLVAP